MAVLSIREYEHLPHLSNGGLPVGKEPALASQTVAIGGASVASAAFTQRTKFIRVWVDLACSLEFGDAPEAVAGSCNLSAQQTEYFGVEPGTKVAVIAI
jgi:hypothetical protein